MKETLILFDGSRKLHKDVPMAAIEEIARLRPLDVEYCECPGLIDNFSAQALDKTRNQVNTRQFLEKINDTEIMQHYAEAGKLIIVDHDLFSEGMNWGFGVSVGDSRGLGYVLLSTARVQSIPQAKDIVSHELGHMFGAPSKPRTNTTENLGIHCINDLCVMQQKAGLFDAIKYAKQRAGAKTYCEQCEQDIRGFRK